MQLSSKTLALLFLLAALSIPPGAAAHQEAEDVTRQMLLTHALPNIPGHNLTALTVELPPGHIAPAHKHDAFLYVYVLSGKLRSRLDDEAAVDYAAGESWIEKPGAIHSLTQNLSKTEPAKLLVVFIRKDGAKLSMPAEE